ncbi:MAG: amidase [Blastomonas fulva]|uniref:amidase n=1 Tax=Blastomonas fulva TaxID=1550728 RepID=UPI0024E224AF|nr:amidase [Blastomonas fulva]MDK2756550.1 amidase [Blastomonas fulva]
MRTLALALAALAPITLPLPALAQDEPRRIARMAVQVEEKSIPELSAMLAAGTISSEELARAYLDRIDALGRKGPKLNSVIAVMPGAIEEARMLDAERKAGTLRGPLHGIPILIKDNIEAKGPVPTTAGSTALLANVTERDAPLVARLRAAGAIILGKTNLSQWANIRSDNSVSGWSSVGGLVKNPYALDRNSCGSSSGSGAAAAASLAAATIGTETDGSIICPSSINGLVGFKPTLGLVSRTHVIPISHSQDTAGPMARSVTDAALVLTALAGSDPADPATAQADARKTDYAAGLSPGYLQGVRIGVLKDRTGSNARVQAVFAGALDWFAAAGAELVEIEDSRTGLDGLGEAEFKVLMTELKADLNAYLASTPTTVKARTLKDIIAYNAANAVIELAWFDQGLFDLAESQKGLDDPEYREALAKSKRLAGPEGIDKLLKTHDVRFLIGPSNAPAWVSDLVNGDHSSGPSQSQLPAVAGYPHITVPMGYVAGLPVGLSIIGGQWQDHDVIKAGYAFEQASKARVAPSYSQRADAVADPIAK